MAVVKQAEKKKKQNPFLPIIGLVIVVCFGIIAYFSSPFLVDLIRENLPQIDEQVSADPDGPRNLRIAVGVMVWFILSSIFMMISAANRGKDIVQDEYSNLRPRGAEATDKALDKYDKELSKNRQAQIKALKKLQKKKEREQRGR